jgi:hypothetical protein
MAGGKDESEEITIVTSPLLNRSHITYHTIMEKLS